LFANMPGGALGFLIVVNILVFILGCFIDFFEIAFIVIPMLAPVAEKLLPTLFPAGTSVDGIMVWFGVVIAMNLQTSFLTPPFGFALFYLRSVAPAADYADKVTKKVVARVTTGQIYRGSVPFVILQLVMLAVIWTWPGIVTNAIDGGKKIDASDIKIELPSDGEDQKDENEEDEKPFGAGYGTSEGKSDAAPAASDGEKKN
ncbi:MAG: TRAP transporter large permease subunit, partial [Burkholderiaceae bacterium]